MAGRAKKLCGRAECTKASIQGKPYCEQHTVAWQGSTHLPNRSRNSQWPMIARAVMERDSNVCYLCNSPGADTIDHKIPLVLGGTDDMDNLAPVHDREYPHCHRAKSRRDGRA